MRIALKDGEEAAKTRQETAGARGSDLCQLHGLRTLQPYALLEQFFVNGDDPVCIEYAGLCARIPEGKVFSACAQQLCKNDGFSDCIALNAVSGIRDSFEMKLGISVGIVRNIERRRG